MKINLILIVLAFFAFGSSVQAQSPEEMQKMMDSIMEDVPDDQKAFIQQMMKKGQEADNRRQAQKEQAKKEQIVKNKQAQKKNEEEFYWRNKIASDTQGIFSTWPHGRAEIKTFYWDRNRNKIEHTVGFISADGQVTLELPEIDRLTVSPMSKGQHESERLIGNRYMDLEYSNLNAGYFSTRHNLIVYVEGNAIGTIDIGNSIKPVVNLNAPCCFDKAGDGYTAYWVYTTQGNSITGVKQIAGTPGNEGKVVCDLDFKAGWNLILERIEGEKEKPSSGIPGKGFWKNQFYTASTVMPSDAKFYFTSNF